MHNSKPNKSRRLNASLNTCEHQVLNMRTKRTPLFQNKKKKTEKKRNSKTKIIYILHEFIWSVNGKKVTIWYICILSYSYLKIDFIFSSYLVEKSWKKCIFVCMILPSWMNHDSFWNEPASRNSSSRELFIIYVIFFPHDVKSEAKCQKNF